MEYTTVDEMHSARPHQRWSGPPLNQDKAATPNREKRMAETFAAAANLSRLNFTVGFFAQHRQRNPRLNLTGQPYLFLGQFAAAADARLQWSGLVTDSDLPGVDLTVSVQSPNLRRGSEGPPRFFC